MTMIDEIRERLGLGADAVLRQVAEGTVSGGSTGWGLAGPEPTLAEVVTRARQSFGLLEIDPRLPSGCKALDSDPRFLIAESGVGVEIAGITLSLSDDIVVVDTRHQVACVSWQTEEGDAIAGFRGGDYEIYFVEREAPESLRAFRDGTVSPLPIIDVPAISWFLAGETAEPWLCAAFDERRASPSVLDRVAAAGLVRRLWAPPPGAAAGVVERLLAGEESPAQRADTWARALPPDVVEEVEGVAVRAAGALADELATLAEVHAALPGGLHEVQATAALRRDDLQSVLVMLRSARAGDSLALALADVDRVAEQETSARIADAVHDVDDVDEHLLTVNWSEPEAWWGVDAG